MLCNEKPNFVLSVQCIYTLEDNTTVYMMFIHYIYVYHLSKNMYHTNRAVLVFRKYLNNKTM